MKMRKSWRRKHVRSPRNCKGAGLVESAVALILMTTITVLGVAFLADIGALVNYKIKLNAIADAAARYAADETNWMGTQRPQQYFSPKQVQTLTNNVVAELLKDEGMDFSKTVNAPVSSDASGQVCVVTLTVDKLPLPFPIGLLPRTISDVEVAAVPYPNDTPIGVLTLNWKPYYSSTVSGIIIPAYGMYSGPKPPGYAYMTNQFAGTPPKSGTHNPYPGGKFPYWLTGVYYNSPTGL